MDILILRRKKISSFNPRRLTYNILKVLVIRKTCIRIPYFIITNQMVSLVIAFLNGQFNSFILREAAVCKLLNFFLTIHPFFHCKIILTCCRVVVKWISNFHCMILPPEFLLFWLEFKNVNNSLPVHLCTLYVYVFQHFKINYSSSPRYLQF